MISTLFARNLGDNLISQITRKKGRGHKRSNVLTLQDFFFIIKHMPKISGYSNKSVFILRIKGGMKKGGELQSQNCFEPG